MPVLPFSTDAEVVRFAKAFLCEHLERFRKDIKICLTPDKNKAHAYFPALMSCSLASDVEKSAKKYMRCLATDSEARDNFKKCMVVYFPQWGPEPLAAHAH